MAFRNSPDYIVAVHSALPFEEVHPRALQDREVEGVEGLPPQAEPGDTPVKVVPNPATD